MICVIFFVVLLSTTNSKTTYQFTFPDSDNYPYVQLSGTIDHPLDEYTLCHWAKVNGIISWGTIFSYTTTDRAKSIMSSIHNSGMYEIYQNGVSLVQKESKRPSLIWFHSCITSSALRGKWNLYFNGIGVWSGEDITQKNQIPPNGTVVLGQPYPATSNFPKFRNFKGHIADVFLWDRMLGNKEIAQVYGCNIPNEANVISWNLHSWVPVNGVRISEVDLPCGE